MLEGEKVRVPLSIGQQKHVYKLEWLKDLSAPAVPVQLLGLHHCPGGELRKSVLICEESGRLGDQQIADNF